MIEIHQLRYILAAADMGSFSRAAELFGIKQSTLSRHILNFELRMGLSLFDRSTRGVVATGAGEGFLHRARQILQDVDALSSDGRALARGVSGTLRLGFQGSLAKGNLAETVQQYRTGWPSVHLSATEQDGARLLRALERDQLDLVICGAENHGGGLTSLCVWREPVVAAIACDHPLAGVAPLYWTDLRKSSFVVSTADFGADLSDLIVSRLAGPGRSPLIARQGVRGDNLLSFALGDRIAIGMGLQEHAGLPVVTQPLYDAFGPTLLEQRAYWREENSNPALREFMAMLIDRLNQDVVAPHERDHIRRVSDLANQHRYRF